MKLWHGSCDLGYGWYFRRCSRQTQTKKTREAGDQSVQAGEGSQARDDHRGSMKMHGAQMCLGIGGFSLCSYTVGALVIV